MRLISMILALMLLVSGGDGKTFQMDGSTHISVAGQEEDNDNMLLNVSINGKSAEISMLDFEILGFKGLSFEGRLSLDGSEQIIGFSDTKIRGFSPISVKSITGTINEKSADILVKGKAALVFNFSISYKGERLANQVSEQP